jgi:hypothetical protein
MNHPAVTADERRLLELLTASADGTTDALLVAHGFDFDLMARLVRERLATATPERVYAGGKSVEVTRVRITDAGRRALAGKDAYADALANDPRFTEAPKTGKGFIIGGVK